MEKPKRQTIHPDDVTRVRNQAGLTLAGLAELCDVDEGTMRRWEGVKDGPPLSLRKAREVARSIRAHKDAPPPRRAGKGQTGTPRLNPDQLERLAQAFEALEPREPPRPTSAQEQKAAGIRLELLRLREQELKNAEAQEKREENRLGRYYFPSADIRRIQEGLSKVQADIRTELEKLL